MVDLLAKSIKITQTQYASLLKKLRKSTKPERRGMLTRGGLTPAGQFFSSLFVHLLRQNICHLAINPSSPSLLSRPCTI